MGNAGSDSRRHHNHHLHHRSPPSTPPPAELQQPSQSQTTVITTPSHYPNPNLPLQSNLYHSGYFLPPPSLDYHRCPSAVLTPQVQHQKTVTIRNDVNIKKDSIRIEEDRETPGRFLVAFTFDAIAPGSITIAFFGKEGVECDLISTKENVTKPVNVSFEQGIGQKFRQPEGTGVDFSMFEEIEWKTEGEDGVYPLMVKAEVHPSKNAGQEENLRGNSQITLAVFDRKEKGEYTVRVMKQILWVNNTRYELQEIYGIGSSAGIESDENDPGKECVICMSEPRDTTVLPCRHMCMCSDCAKLLQFRTKRCPICRQPVERLLEIKVNNGGTA